jgi:hypothetical protein
MVSDVSLVVRDSPRLRAARAKPSDPVHQIPPKGDALVWERLTGVDHRLRFGEALLGMGAILRIKVAGTSRRIPKAGDPAAVAPLEDGAVAGVSSLVSPRPARF